MLHIAIRINTSSMTVKQHICTYVWLRHNILNYIYINMKLFITVIFIPVRIWEHENASTCQPIFLTFRSVINYGHGKISIIFSTGSRTVKGGGGGLSFNMECYSEWFYAGTYNHTLLLSISYNAEHFFLLPLLQCKLLWMKVRKFNSTLCGILFVKIPYNLIALQHFSLNQ